MLRHILGPCRNRGDLKLDELVHFAAEVIPKLADRPDYGRATAIPDARTVRYYIQQRLVDRPHGSSGTSGLYGYRHLLQLVAVKVLQGQYMPMEKIRAAIGGLENHELERRLEGWAATPREMWVQSPSDWQGRRLEAWAPRQLLRSKLFEGGQTTALKFVNYLKGTSQDRAPHDEFDEVGLDTAAMHVQDESAPHKEKEEVTGDSPHVPPPEEAAGSAAVEGWSRYELHPGIELHVRQGVRLPENPSFVSALGSRLRAILARMGRRGT